MSNTDFTPESRVELAERVGKAHKLLHSGEITIAEFQTRIGFVNDKMHRDLDAYLEKRFDEAAGAAVCFSLIANKHEDAVTFLMRNMFGIQQPEIFFMHAAMVKAVNDFGLKRAIRNREEREAKGAE